MDKVTKEVYANVSEQNETSKKIDLTVQRLSLPLFVFESNYLQILSLIGWDISVQCKSQSVGL